AGAMSSTAIGLQVLAERRALATRFGRASFAVLLFQDLAAMPVLFAIGLLLPAGHASGGARTLALAAAQGLAALAAIALFGRIALRPILRGVARTQSPDLFMAACLLVVLGAALAAAAAHLSMALGALVGGLLLAGTEYRRAVEEMIEPFKGLGVGVFLITVGMGLDLGRVIAHPAAILGGVAALLAVKLAVMGAAGRAGRLSAGDAARAGLLLAPGGEFGLVILAQAGAQGVLGPAVAADAQVVTALSMALLPGLAALGGHAARRFAAPVDPALLAPAGMAAPGVVLAGYGRMGRMVGELLDRHAIPWIAIERDVDAVTRARAEGRPVYYGDVSRIALLRRIGIGAARALVATMDNRAAIDAVVAAARRERADLPVIARARDAAHAAHLYRMGVSNAVPETIEASLQLGEAVLTDLGLPAGPVIVSIHETRAALQAEIRRAAPAAPPSAPGRRRARDVRGGVRPPA
ncbi:MAG: cation:proton antiporter, partial [Rhodospirillales bacterium]|nr:cation:proton antiporter [Rhodospirillales bacterium]